MRRAVFGTVCTFLVLLNLTAFPPVELKAQDRASTSGSHPDFSGVYYPYRQGGGAPEPDRNESEGPPPAPTRSAPTGDLSQGRSPNAPRLTPEYLAKWEVVRESRMSGSYEYDNIANCLPPGMPHMMSMAYGMEVMQTEDKITFFSEWQDALRRVYLDGRQASEEVLNDPTYAGYSTGRWEGDTLVVETVALTTKSYIDGSTPHSEEMRVSERIRFIAEDILEDRITVYDPVALIEPWEVVRTYRRASPPADELREFACAEGLRDAPH
jgi:hypothetical protein